MSKVIKFPTNKDWCYHDEAAAYLGMAPQTLSNKCSNGVGPQHEKKYGRLRYKFKDLDAYDKANTEVFEAYR